MGVKGLALIGSTGSIGGSTLSVVDAFPDRLRVVSLAAGDNADLLASQVARYSPAVVGMATADAIDRLRSTGVALPPVVGVGADGLIGAATHPDVDMVICASSGSVALEAILAAIDAGKTIALANKEVLVMAGALVTAAARRNQVSILPVDSEHNAIHQCLHGRNGAEIKRLILTASGGPFRQRSQEALERATLSDALQHPTWQMGRKITIDSATLMNKGLEVIEAHWLFGVRPDQIDVVIHPQSVVHSLVEFIDGSLLAQLGVTDMRLPIQYACSYPQRWAALLPSLDLARAGRLEFEAPAFDRFPCLGLAYRALRAGESVPCVLNAANEIAVASFLEGRVGFTDIPQIIERTMDAHAPVAADTLAAVRSLDTWARQQAAHVVESLPAGTPR
jgi:1-deoxy-D-xylulose-5-phosphate reductoisomerase